MRRAGHRWALLAIVLLAFALRAHNLGRAPLWFDEALSGTISAQGWRDIVLASSTTPFEHPPLYYMALHLWRALTGSGGFSLRFFSLFWGVLLVPLLYRFVRDWGGHRLAVLTALLAAISVSHIEQSQNARMYTAVVLLSVLSLYLFFRALQSGRRLEWAGYLLATGIGIALHYYFVLLILVPVAFLAQRGPRYRRVLVVMVVTLAGAGLLAASWLWFLPGPRQAIGQILRGEGAGVSSLALRVRHTIGGLLMDEPAAGPLVLGILALMGALFWPQPLRLYSQSMGRPRRFVLTWLLVPWLIALAIPYYLQGRHLAYLWPALFTLAGAGLLALFVRRRWLFLVALLLVAVTSGYGLHRSSEEALGRPDYAQAIVHIEDRALPGDLVIMDQPALWPFVDTYAQKDLQRVYVTGAPALTEEAVRRQLEPVVKGHDRIWLGPISAWTADPEGLVSKWLDTNAFQASRQWFQGSTWTALYFTPAPLSRLPVSRIRWENGIRLLSASSSSMDVVPGDAVRVEFQWEAAAPVDAAAAVWLDLVDEQGNVWATRSSEPCNGSCPTDRWEHGTVYQDRHALLVPLGTPPGTYRLQLSWYIPEDGAVSLVERNGAKIDLGPVNVGRVDRLPADVGPGASLANSVRAEFGGQLALLGFDVAQRSVSADQALLVDLYWLVLDSPSGDLVLRLELVDRDDHVVASWERPPIAGFFPARDWRAGDYVRGSKRLDMPGQVLPGSYRLRLTVLDQTGQPLSLTGSQPRQAVRGMIRWDARLKGDSLDLAPIQILEKPERVRAFDLPVVSHSLDLQVADQAELIGYDLETATAVPGGRLDLTLYWRARGAMDGSYKVFTHLGDGIHPPISQDDALPGEGCCPTNTWVEGEIVVDPHTIFLPDDPPPGTYRLTAGLYNEFDGQRLPVFDATGSRLGDQVLIAEVALPPALPAVPEAARTRLPFEVHLPLVSNDW